MADVNVLLLVLDSVRARNASLHGYHRQTTPFLESYHDCATVYRQARSPGIHSVASHASIWTGAHVEQHQVKRHEETLREGTTVWESLADRGYRTGIFTTNPVVAHSSNLADAFEEQFTDDFVDNKAKLFADAHSPADVVRHEGITGNLRRCLTDEKPFRSLLNSTHHFYRKIKGNASASMADADLVDEFLIWADEPRSEQPWAACINLMDAHFPYEPSPEFDLWGGEELRALHGDLTKPPANEFIRGRPWWQLEAFEHLYDGAIRQVDNHVRRVVSGIEDLGMHDDTLVVITSDHGEGFGERSALNGRTRLVDHSWGIDEVLTHVPLVVKYPNQSESRTVEGLASLVEFPRAVGEAIDGSAEPESFVPNEPVVASTDRLLKADDGIFEGSTESTKDYYGPWRAVYEKSGGDIRKYATRDGEAVVERIDNAESSTVVEHGGADVVEKTFRRLSPRNLKGSTQQAVSTEVENRLAELGYLR